MYSNNNVRHGRRAALVTALIASTHIAIATGAPPDHAPGLANFPDITLPDKAQGQAAIDALGGQLPDVAAAYGMAPAQFERLFQ